MNKKYILMATLLLLLVFALLQIDRQSLIGSLRQIPLWLILLLCSLQILTQLLVNLQWHRILKLSGSSLSFKDMFYINSQGAVMDAITPGVKFGGEVTRVVQLSRMGNIPREQAAAVIAMQKMLSIGALVFVLMFAARQYIFAIAALILLVCIGLFFARKWKRMRAFLSALRKQIKNTAKNKKAFVALFGLSLFIWLLYPAKMYIVAMQFYPTANMFYIVGITFAAYMVAMLPIFPGGVGGFEGTMSGLLIAAGYAINDAAVITILFRFITFWFVLLFSLAFIGFCKARRKLC